MEQAIIRAGLLRSSGSCEDDEVPPKRRKLTSSTPNPSLNGCTRLSKYERIYLARELEAFRTKLSSTETASIQLHRMRQQMNEMFDEEEKVLGIQAVVAKEGIAKLEASLQTAGNGPLETLKSGEIPESQISAMRSRMWEKIKTLQLDNGMTSTSAEPQENEVEAQRQLERKIKTELEQLLQASGSQNHKGVYVPAQQICSRNSRKTPPEKERTRMSDLEGLQSSIGTTLTLRETVMRKLLLEEKISNMEKKLDDERGMLQMLHGECEKLLLHLRKNQSSTSETSLRTSTSSLQRPKYIRRIDRMNLRLGKSVKTGVEKIVVSSSETESSGTSPENSRSRTPHLQLPKVFRRSELMTRKSEESKMVKVPMTNKNAIQSHSESPGTSKDKTSGLQHSKSIRMTEVMRIRHEELKKVKAEMADQIVTSSDTESSENLKSRTPHRQLPKVFRRTELMTRKSEESKTVKVPMTNKNAIQSHSESPGTSKDKTSGLQHSKSIRMTEVMRIRHEELKKVKADMADQTVTSSDTESSETSKDKTPHRRHPKITRKSELMTDEYGESKAVKVVMADKNVVSSDTKSSGTSKGKAPHLHPIAVRKSEVMSRKTEELKKEVSTRNKTALESNPDSSEDELPPKNLDYLESLLLTSSDEDESSDKSPGNDKKKASEARRARDLRITVGDYYVLVSDRKFFETDWATYYEREGRLYVCKDCPEIASRKIAVIQDHIWVKHCEGRLVCPFCRDPPYSMQSRYRFLYHLRREHPEQCKSK
ncbi:uncharacterized protein LOC107047727 [Diachasma alloeum]|uniref:uncharacterized protein LOC107047727 n=1 Tax=Diachasma alloeum TaxID=454923 RepID=UPI00073832DC|nr:uncharacterized protein LOC107047727 [Diachasma alloeum]